MNIETATAIAHAIAILRESAKQHRMQGDGAGHGTGCDRAADMLAAQMTAADKDEVDAYYADLMTRIRFTAEVA